MVRSILGLLPGLLRLALVIALVRVVRALRLEKTVVSMAGALLPGLGATVLRFLPGGLATVLIGTWVVNRLLRAWRESEGRRAGAFAAPGQPAR